MATMMMTIMTSMRIKQVVGIMSFILSSILPHTVHAFLPIVPYHHHHHHHHHHHVPASYKSSPPVHRWTNMASTNNEDNHHNDSINNNNNNNNDDDDLNEGALFYSDFGDFIPGQDDTGAFPPIPTSSDSALSVGSASVTSSSSSSTSSSTSSMEEDSSTTTTNTSDSDMSVLQERFQKVKETEQEEKKQLQMNWNMGNWNVRGFSLDPYNANTAVGQDDTSTRTRKTGDESNDDINTNPAAATAAAADDDGSTEGIIITQLCTADLSSSKSRNDDSDDYYYDYDDDEDNDKNIIVVGRSDGSVCVVSMGSEYWTQFESKLSLQQTSDFTVSVESKLVRRENSNNDFDDNEDNMIQEDNDNDDDDNTDAEPFEIMTQFMAHEQSKITALKLVVLAHHTETTTSTSTSPTMTSRRILVTGDECGSLSIWALPDGSSTTPQQQQQQHRVMPLRNLDAVHQKKIVALHMVSMLNDQNQEQPSLLFSASLDGTMALWDIMTGDNIYSCRTTTSIMTDDNKLNDDDNNNHDDDHAIHCAAVHENQIYVGLGNGMVFTYFVQDMVEAAATSMDACPLPSGRFVAHEKSAVTSMTCAGPGQMGQRSGSSSTILITGGADGIVKQWELLTRTVPASTTTTSGGNANFSTPTTSRRTVEHWPRLKTQRIPQRAHLFQGHYGPITALAATTSTNTKNDDTIAKTSTTSDSMIVSADIHGTVRAWSCATGKELYTMDGFDPNTLTSLLLLQHQGGDDDGNGVGDNQNMNALITNGMKQFVCIHDFDVGTVNKAQDGFELEW